MSSKHQSPSPFAAIFTAVLALTIASGGTAYTIANRPSINEQQEEIFDHMISLCTLGSTTLIGLLSSQLLNGNDDDDDNA
ncbi:MAG: hypothetical protein AAGD25_13225 [Cyanobacteria bacterium P01_F01_bin.150]